MDDRLEPAAWPWPSRGISWRGLITHNSPRGIHDREAASTRVSIRFNDYIHRANPKLVIHGHQHQNSETQFGRITIIGAYGYWGDGDMNILSNNCPLGISMLSLPPDKEDIYRQLARHRL